MSSKTEKLEKIFNVYREQDNLLKNAPANQINKRDGDGLTEELAFEALNKAAENIRKVDPTLSPEQAFARAVDVMPTMFNKASGNLIGHL